MYPVVTESLLQWKTLKWQLFCLWKTLKHQKRAVGSKPFMVNKEKFMRWPYGCSYYSLQSSGHISWLRSKPHAFCRNSHMIATLPMSTSLPVHCKSHERFTMYDKLRERCRHLCPIQGRFPYGSGKNNTTGFPWELWFHGNQNYIMFLMTVWGQQSCRQVIVILK